jgi:two-component system OmpR family response regulator
MQPQRLEAVFPEVLLVAPDTHDRQATADYLRQNGFALRLAGDAEAMDETLRSAEVDLVLLDLGLPGQSGLSICRRLGRKTATPVVVMTGTDSDADRIVALELGADDCVSRPSNPRELVARMRAVLRRTAAAPIQAPGKDLGYAFLGFELDVVRRQLKSPSGAVVLLPPSELSLLAVFLQHPDKVLSRERLIELVRREDVGILDRAIDTHVSRLRRKLAAHSQSELIATVYGVGYRCTAEVTRL